MNYDALYREVTEKYGPALGRLAAAYEAEPTRKRELLKGIHAAVWRSLVQFDQQCSLRAWAYRVAHNVATAHLIRHAGLPSVELEETAAPLDPRLARARVLRIIRALPPIGRTCRETVSISVVHWTLRRD